MFGLMRVTSHRRLLNTVCQEFELDRAVLAEQLAIAKAQLDGYERGAQALRDQRTALEAEIAALKGSMMALCHKHGEALPEKWGT